MGGLARVTSDYGWTCCRAHERAYVNVRVFMCACIQTDTQRHTHTHTRAHEHTHANTYMCILMVHKIKSSGQIERRLVASSTHEYVLLRRSTQNNFVLWVGCD